MACFKEEGEREGRVLCSGIKAKEGEGFHFL